MGVWIGKLLVAPLAANSYQSSIGDFVYGNCTWFGQKEPIKVQISPAPINFHQICTLIGSLKYIKC